MEITKLRGAIKRRAETTTDDLKSIIAESLAGASEGAVVNLPSQESIQRAVRRHRANHFREKKNHGDQKDHKNVDPVVLKRFADADDCLM